MPPTDDQSAEAQEQQGAAAEPLGPREVIDRLKSHYADLSPQLQRAARYVVDNPGDVAVRSMRSIAKKAGVQHNAMVRLAREFGFDGYDQFRDLFRDLVIRESDEDWLERARTIRERFPVGSDSQIVGEYVMQETENLQRTFGKEIAGLLKTAVDELRDARRIYVLGVRSMFALAYYFHYTWRMFDTRTVLLTGLGGAFADDLRSVQDTDVMVIFSQYPYANDAIVAADFARQRGARIICITDSEVSPIVGEGDVTIIVSNNAVSLFPTLVPAMSIAQILTTMVLSEGGDESIETLEKTQEQLEGFGVYRR